MLIGFKLKVRKKKIKAPKISLNEQLDSNIYQIDN